MEGRGADEREVPTDVAKQDKLKVSSVVRIVDEPFGVRFGTCTAIESSGVTVLIWPLAASECNRPPPPLAQRRLSDEAGFDTMVSQGE